jgi:hypothetical protein
MLQRQWNLIATCHNETLLGSPIDPRVVKASDQLRCPSVRHIRPLRSTRTYLSIFKHILENIQRISQLSPIATDMSIRPSVRHILIRRLYLHVRHL